MKSHSDVRRFTPIVKNMSSQKNRYYSNSSNAQGFAKIQSSAALNQFLNRLPPDIADSFSREQLIAIQASLHRQRHSVDIRLTIPFIWQKFYVVLLVGPERRSTSRLRTERKNYPVWTTANLLFITGFISLSLLFMVGLFSLKMSMIQRWVQTNDYPTSVPFKLTQIECEQSGRSWQNGECIDYEHSPTF